MAHESRAALVQAVEQWLAFHDAAYQALTTTCIDWLQAHITAATPTLSDEARVVLAITMLATLVRCFEETLLGERRSDDHDEP